MAHESGLGEGEGCWEQPILARVADLSLKGQQRRIKPPHSTQFGCSSYCLARPDVHGLTHWPQPRCATLCGYSGPSSLPHHPQENKCGQAGSIESPPNAAARHGSVRCEKNVGLAQGYSDGCRRQWCAPVSPGARHRPPTSFRLAALRRISCT